MVKNVTKEWGHEVIFAETETYRAKILTIYKGKSIHLQRHKEKDETMYVLSGNGFVITDTPGEFKQLNPGDIVHVPPGCTHKFWAALDTDMVIVEVCNNIPDDDIEHLEQE